MSTVSGEVNCCCDVFPIRFGVYLIVFHCFLEAIYGVSLVLSSFYKPSTPVILYANIATHLIFVPTGMIILWANLYENWKGAKASAVFAIIAGIVNFVMSCLYFAWFLKFDANSLLDKNFFWHSENDWVDQSEAPFTVWHILAFVLIINDCFWFYYSDILFKLSNLLKAEEYLENENEDYVPPPKEEPLPSNAI